MARPLRIEFVGALYHVTSRGNGREDIYLKDEERKLFMKVLGSFGKTEKVAIKNYMQFVANGVQQPSPWLKLKNQIYLGSDDFVDNVQLNISKKNLSEISKIQKRAVPKSLKQYEKESVGRNDAIVMAYRSGGFTLAEIGEYLHCIILQSAGLFIIRCKNNDLTLFCLR